MTNLCIKKFKEGNENPLTTVSIPLVVIKMVKSLIPKKAKEELMIQQGVATFGAINPSSLPNTPSGGVNAP